MNFIIKMDEKGWFKGLGLHHAFVTLLGIGLGHLFDFGPIMAIFFIGWYARHEWGGDVYPPAAFEIMDFISPVIICSGYLLLITKIGVLLW